MFIDKLWVSATITLLTARVGDTYVDSDPPVKNPHQGGPFLLVGIRVCQ